MPDDATFLFEYRPPREPFAPNEAEAGAIRRHFRYLQRLHARRTLFMAGRREDARAGYAVVRATDQSAAEALAAADPVVAEGVFTVSVCPFVLALGAFAPDTERPEERQEP